jgi:hypothetical protein
MGDPDLDGHSVDEHHFVAPVELVGLAPGAKESGTKASVVAA